MKRILSLLLVLVMLAGLAGLSACKSKEEDSDSGSGKTTEQAEPTFEKAEDHLNYVVNKSGKKVAEGVGELVEAIPLIGGPYTQNVDLSVNISEKAINLISSMLKDRMGDMDLSFFRSLRASMTFASGEKTVGQKTALYLNDRKIADVSEYINETAVVVSSDLLTENAVIPLEMLLGKDGGKVFDAVDMKSIKYDGIRNALGSEFLSAIVQKYLKIAVGELTDVVRAEETLTVQGVAQNLTAFKFTLDGDKIVRIAKAVLNALKDDREIVDKLGAVIEDMKQYVKDEKVLAEISDVDIAAKFKEGIEELIGQLDNSSADFADFPQIAVAVYSDAKNRIKALAVSFSTENEYTTRSVSGFIGLTESESQYGFEALLSTTIKYKLEGSDSTNFVSAVSTGAKTGSKLTGDIDISYSAGEDAKKIITVSVEDFDIDALYDGAFVGKVYVKAVDICDAIELFTGPEKMISSIRSFLKMMGTVEIVVEGSGRKNDQKFDFYLRQTVEDKSENLVTVTMTAKMTSGAQVDEIRGESRDVAELGEIPQLLDINVLVNNLKAAGVPEELLAGLLGKENPV